MSWRPNFMLGPLGGEILIPCQVTKLSASEENVELSERNMLGASFKSYQRVNVPEMSLGFARLPDDFMAVLRGLAASLNPLNFIFNTTLAAKFFQATSQSTTSIIIPPMSATGVVITGVYLATDYAQAGTNYYSAGSSFDATGGGTGLGLITLATALAAAQTDVIINYTYSGISCYIKVSAEPHLGAYSGYWQGTLTLSGA